MGDTRIPDEEEESVLICIQLEDDTFWYTSRPLLRHDADLILQGFGMEHVPEFLTKITMGQRVVKAKLLFRKAD